MLTGVAAFLSILIALLAIPVGLTFHVAWPDYVLNDVKLRWAFGLIRINIPSARLSAHLEGSSQKAEIPKHDIRDSRRSTGKTRSILALVRQDKLRKRIVRFIKKQWHAITKKDLYLRVRVGLGDPADTGRLWAVFGPLAGMFANARSVSIEIEPDFADVTFDVDSSGSIQLIPLQVLYHIAALMMSPTVWIGIWQSRTAAT